jgi:hypothetical protein
MARIEQHSFAIDLLGDGTRFLKSIDRRSGLSHDERVIGVSKVSRSLFYSYPETAEAERQTWIAPGYPDSVIRRVTMWYEI